MTSTDKIIKIRPNVEILSDDEPAPHVNIVAMLRKVANEIEDGTYKDVTCAGYVMTVADGAAVFGWGDVNHLEMIGLFTLAAQKVGV